MKIKFRICPICNCALNLHPIKPTMLYSCACGFTRWINYMDILKYKDITMGRDSQYPNDFNDEIKQNIIILLERINPFLNELKITTCSVTSGWRPPSVNANTQGASKKSSHQSGQAVDILDDKDKKLAKMILDNKELLEKYNLYMENPDFTNGKYTNWVHLQSRPTKSGNRIFIP